MKPLLIAGLAGGLAVVAAAAVIAGNLANDTATPETKAPITVAATAPASAETATATEQTTVTLAVDNMYCASCPFIVRQALTETPGVIAAEVSFRDKTARVTFDRATVDVAALTEATTRAGYPSRLVP